MSQPNPYILAAENPSALLTLLRANPSIASGQDEHGYSLLHAAASYGHIDLLRALVKEFNVDVNLLDEDGETCLFVTESVEIAKCLVEELGVDYNKRNDEGLAAYETIENDDSFPEVADYLRQVAGVPAPAPADSSVDVALNQPPPLPANLQLNLGTVSEQEANAGIDQVDPEFKRRIDELAAREDFHSEATQAQLRELVMDALRGSSIETDERGVRRRTD
ncbi:ankyrin repeat protein [Aspergillus brunneoviolaceus CBS 621.78]|uniref:Ankyrin repeat protein n=2 Tax=Aspergillus TaxID=5052 RepID=A0A8G1S0N1_9EURO|nr:ankyrin repeat protein [Aspergillus brunneoviolaceus CBS 621.78]XP_040806359.1 ankyrin repeat protein [Aspergillus fijiensis CBS 313.89]RAH40195.1 ankyrin repeat protein [Aspergillus brunneoviolaceus CBS 621.78]RAK82349.1 ankyrin repeat protein [Aspergillus fijiensis CBS 313.89]